MTFQQWLDREIEEGATEFVITLQTAKSRMGTTIRVSAANRRETATDFEVFANTIRAVTVRVPRLEESDDSGS